MFAGVSLFVGAFQIFNTFSITVAQRTREFGMLRTLGASRPQLLATVGFEALVLGLLGAALGLAGGVGFAFGINELFKAVGIDLPNTGTVVTLRTVIVSLIVGVVVTLVAALVPALRATRVTPMAALRESELQDSKPRSRAVTAVALVVGCAGLAMMLIGLFGGIEDSGSAAGLLGGGAALMLFGVSLFSPRLVRPLASLTGRPLERLRGLTGRLARENAMRKPGRTATTAAALMIGLALVVFVTIFASGLKTSVAKTIDESFRGEIVLQNSDGFSPIPREAVRRARGGRRRGDGVVDHLRHRRAAERRRERARGGGRSGHPRHGARAHLQERRPVRARGTRAARRDRGRRLRARQGARRWATRCACAPRSSERPRSGCAAPSRASSTCSGRRSWTRAPRASSAGCSRASRWRGSRRTPRRSGCRTRWTPS